MIKMTAHSNLPVVLLRFRAIRESIEREMLIQIDLFHSLYKTTTDNWEGTKPKFVREFENTSNAIIGRVYTQDKIYRFLHDGTATRWALMNKGYISETTPRLFSSRKKVGEVVVRTRGKMMAMGIPAQKGIEAREWTQEIIKRYEKKFHKAMTLAVLKGIGGN